MAVGLLLLQSLKTESQEVHGNLKGLGSLVKARRDWRSKLIVSRKGPHTGLPHLAAFPTSLLSTHTTNLVQMFSFPCIHLTAPHPSF